MNTKDYLTLDHEILTDSGWKHCMKITVEDKVAVLKDITKPTVIDFEYPEEFVISEHLGPVYNLKADVIDISTTPSQKLLVSDIDKNNYELRSAENIIFKNVKFLNLKGEVIPKLKKETMTRYIGRVFNIKTTSKFFYVRRNSRELWMSC